MRIVVVLVPVTAVKAKAPVPVQWRSEYLSGRLFPLYSGRELKKKAVLASDTNRPLG